jgi:hypothetical protein
MLNRRGQTAEKQQIIARLDFTSSMTEAVISKVLRDRYCGIIEMKTVRTEALLTPICNAQQRESQDEESRNLGGKPGE